MDSITVTTSTFDSSLSVYSPVASTSALPPIGITAPTPSPKVEKSFQDLTAPLVSQQKKLTRRGSIDTTDTLAVRRAKAGRNRPQGVRRRSSSLDLPKATNGTDEDEVDYDENPPIAPLKPTAFKPLKSSYRLESTLSSDSTISSSSPTTTTSGPSSSISTSFASAGSSSVAPSPLSPPPGAYSYGDDPTRRGSAPVTAGVGSISSWSSSESTTNGSGNSLKKSVSEQAWTSSWDETKKECTSPAPKPSLVSKGPPPLSRSHSYTSKGPGKVSLPGPGSPYKPSLPSPLANVLHPETMGAYDQWTPMSTSGLSPAPIARRSSVHSAGGEFPFPPSPVTGSFSPDIPNTSPQVSPTTPLATPPLPSLPKHVQSNGSPKLHRPERGRSKSGDVIVSPSKSNFIPTGSHWRTTSVSQNSSPMPYPAPLTPPETSEWPRHTSAADLAWNDVGLGRLGLSSLIDYGSRISHSDSIAMAKQPVADLMSLEGEEMPSYAGLGVAQGAGGGSADSRRTTPTENLKRVGNGDLMGGTGGGHFGPATREKLANVMHDLLDGIPLPEDDGTIGIVEYGALNSRSSSLVAPIIASLASRHARMRESLGLPVTDDDTLSFQVTHTDKLQSDFRSLSQQLEQHGDSYLNSQWLDSQQPSLENKVFSSFAARPFAAKVLPKASVSVGFSAMALHWLSMDRKYRMAPATLAHGELMAFLSARATEFKAGGVLTLAFISRSEDDPRKSMSGNLQSRASADARGGSDPLPTLARPLSRERSNSSPAVPTLGKKDIWSILSGILGKAIQRLVSTQLLKPAVARQLLALPIHPRSPKQTKAVLRAMQHAWTVEKEEVMVLSHPAWRGLEHNTVSVASYTDHTIQLLKIFWESEMRSILREALLSRAACEWIIECLFDIAREKVEESGPQPLELEVQIVALRRRKADGPPPVDSY